MSSKLLRSRELECLYWAAQGLTAGQTARLLGIKPTTVQSHRNKAKEKLGCLSLTHAVYECIRMGYMSHEKSPGFIRLKPENIAGQEV
jgi:DNA-binding CsgD family transcriptional regulator